jgi:hypothetical protein
MSFPCAKPEELNTKYISFLSAPPDAATIGTAFQLYVTPLPIVNEKTMFFHREDAENRLPGAA